MDKTFNIFDEYFKTQGINTRYNTLGYTSQMVVSYVNETRDIVGKNQSNICKSRCYSQYYDMKERPKYSGFEWAKEEDCRIREKLYKVVDKDQTREQYFLDGANPELDYLTLLKESLPEGNNLLYLSGGIDSEMAAFAMLDAGIKFTPIILCYTRNGRVVNDYDTVYASVFCVKYQLSPYYHTIEVLDVWNTPEFIDLAIAVGSVSPQQVLYAHAVHEIDKIFPDSLHMFGGEIRYLSDVEAEDNKLADLVMMAKVTPGYNGNVYIAQWIAGQQTSTTFVMIYETNGNWRFSTQPPGMTGTPTSGPYTNTPLSGRYEVQTTCNSYTPNGSSGSTNPAAGVTNAYSVINTGIGAAVLSIGGPAPGNNAQANFTIRCRSVLSPATVVSASVTFRFTS